MSPEDSTDVVSYEVIDRVAWVRLNRPEYRNAQNSAMGCATCSTSVRIATRRKRTSLATYQAAAPGPNGLASSVGMDAQ